MIINKKNRDSLKKKQLKMLGDNKRKKKRGVLMINQWVLGMAKERNIQLVDQIK